MIRSAESVFRVRILSLGSTLFALTLLLAACRKEDPVELETTDMIVAADIDNKGNGADIEVNFRKQFEINGVLEYHIFVIKAADADTYDIPKLTNLDADRFTVARPEEIFPLQGKVLTESARDTDGDLIVEGISYRFAVLSLPRNRDNHLPSLTISQDALTLSKNNIVHRYGNELEGGAGCLSIDSEGNLAMTDYNILWELFDTDDQSSRVYRWSHDAPDIVVDTLPPLAGNAFDKNDNFYQSIPGQGRIIRISQNSEVEYVEMNQPLIQEPDGLYIDEKNIYVADRKTGAIFKIDGNGDVTLFANVGENVRGITRDENGNFYVSINSQEGIIKKISPDGNVSQFAVIPTFIPEFYELRYIMWVGYLQYHEGHIYVAGLSTNQIYKIDAQGTVTTFAGSGKRLVPRGGALTAHLNRPMGLAFAPNGKSLYVSNCTDIVPQHTQASRPSRVYRIELVD